MFHWRYRGTKGGRIWLRLVTLAIGLMLMFSSTASAITPSQINIYTQDNYTDKEKWALAGVNRTLESAGCALFSFAHAVQWLTQTRRGDELLTELIGVCNDPNGMQYHPDCTHSDRNNFTGLAYQNHLRGRYGISSVSVSKSEKAFENLLTTGGVIVFRGPTPSGGHIALAVDFARNSSGVGFIHVIDSHPESFHASSARTNYYDDNFQRWSTYPTNGAHYWIKFSDIAYNGNYRVWIGLRMAPRSVALNVSAATLLLSDAPLELKASVLPATAYQQVVFSSSDPSVAEVSEDGLVTPVAPGTVTITAASSLDASVYTECQLLVAEKLPEISVQGPACVMAGDTALYTGTIQADMFADIPLEWKSSNPAVVSVDAQTGEAVVHAVGDAYISASPAVDYGFSGRLRVRVIPPLQQFTSVLPGKVVVIEENVFAGTSVRYFRCPEGLKRIGSGAFAGCDDLRVIYIPESVESIAGDAFANCPDLVIWTSSSYAAEFARARGIALYGYNAE